MNSRSNPLRSFDPLIPINIFFHNFLLWFLLDQMFMGVFDMIGQVHFCTKRVIAKMTAVLINTKLEHIRNNDPVLNDKFENKGGLANFRVEFTRVACDAYEILCQGDSISHAFKACGLCNDKNGGERHLIKCPKLLTFQAPGKNYKYRNEPYTEKEIHTIYMAEIESLFMIHKQVSTLSLFIILKCFVL